MVTLAIPFDALATYPARLLVNEPAGKVQVELLAPLTEKVTD